MMPSGKIEAWNSVDRIARTMRHQMMSSKRSGLWFRLSQRERALFSLALNLRVRFQSIKLARAMVSIYEKLKEMGDPKYRSLKMGMDRAWAFSQAAESWGNKEARAWRNDRAYIDFLGRFLVTF